MTMIATRLTPARKARHIGRLALRLALAGMLFAGPLAALGQAAAFKSGLANPNTGFVLYMTLQRTVNG